MTAPNKVDTPLLPCAASLFDPRRRRHPRDPVAPRVGPGVPAMRQASGRLELLRNIEAIASGRSRLIAGSKISTGLHPSTQERR